VAHVHDHHIDISLRTKRVCAGVSAVLGVAVVIGMLLIGFGTDVEAKLHGVLVEQVYDAKVTKVHVAPCNGTIAADNVPCRITTIRLNAGPDKGETRTIEFPVEGSFTTLRTGDRIVVSYTPDARKGEEYQYSDRQRRPLLLWLTLLFALAVLALGRLHGITALAGLAVSMVVIFAFILPAVLEGHDPVVVAVIGSAAIAYIALYLAHGFNSLTTVALLGTLASLALIIVLSAVFTGLAHFTGVVGEDASLLPALGAKVDVNGLVLAGIVIGALGALDDVTVTQASAVAELSVANPTYDRAQLYRSGVRIGRDHIASTVNTLALAYAGAALPTLLLFLLAHQSLGTVANSEVVAVEIVRTLVGSIGLVAAVPVTTWLAATIVSPSAHPSRRAGRARQPAKPAKAPRPNDLIDPDRQFWDR
jgi:uncharacterized membrane protein